MAQFVWVVPTAILAYKFLTFPAPSIFHSQFSAAFHQSFEGGFLIPEFRDWHDFWTMVGSNHDMMRGKAQLDFTAPFYAGIGYSVAAWRRVSTTLRQVFTKFSEFFICCQFSTRKFASGSPRNDDRQLDGPTACPLLSLLGAHCVFPKSIAAGS